MRHRSRESVFTKLAWALGGALTLAFGLAVVRWFALSVLGAGVVGLLLSAGVAYALARGFSRRIDLLAEGTRRLAAGEYAHRVSDTRKDELGELAAAFDRMAGALQATREGLVHSHAELERSNLQLLEASRLKNEFLANTSHELRTPLNGVMGFLGLIKDGVCGSREEELDWARQAMECAQNLHMLIEDVLEVSRIEAGRLSLTTQAVSIGEALERIAGEMRPRATMNGLELRCDAGDKDLRVRADDRRLTRVLRHLIDNAIKFTHAGSVTLSATVIEGAGHVRIDVCDTGVGIALDQQAQVFERFVQGDGSSTRRYGGTGLGLSLVRDLVEMMGGLVALHSDGPDRGTTVSFTLPLSPGDADAEPARMDPSTPIESLICGPEGGPLVVLVEDDPAGVSWLETQLHAEGFRTVAADSAERGWLLVRQLRPTLVVADHALPCGASARLRSGCDLARQMHSQPALAGIPVLLLSGMAPEWLECLGPLPANVTFLRKPAPREALLEALAQVRRRDAA
jgi:signal transduction histidine kinase/ActR/RegA family two-component response regulator